MPRPCPTALHRTTASLPRQSAREPQEPVRPVWTREIRFGPRELPLVTDPPRLSSPGMAAVLVVILALALGDYGNAQPYRQWRREPAPYDADDDPWNQPPNHRTPTLRGTRSRRNHGEPISSRRHHSYNTRRPRCQGWRWSTPNCRCLRSRSPPQRELHTSPRGHKASHFSTKEHHNQVGEFGLSSSPS